jgi:hypothetical protein
MPCATNAATSSPVYHVHARKAALDSLWLMVWQPLVTWSEGISESHVVQISGFLYKNPMPYHAA